MEKIILSTNTLTEVGVGKLVQNSAWTNLEELDLRANEIGDQGAILISSNESWKNLKKDQFSREQN